MKQNTLFYLFAVALILTTCFLRSDPGQPPSPESPPGVFARTTKFVDRALKAVAIWWLLKDALPPDAIVPESDETQLAASQDIPHHIANSPPRRQVDPDGIPIIDHHEGW